LRLKIILLACLFSLCLAWAVMPTTCQAAETYTMTAKQMQQSLQLLNDLKSDIAILSQNSNASLPLINKLSKKLETAESLIGKSQSETKEALKLVDELRLDVQNLKLSYDQYKKVKEAETKSLKTKITLLEIVVVIETICLILL
jgi:chromosome segregation ATPase